MSAEYSKRIFVHYFKTIGEQAGVHFDGDMIVEIESAVDSLYEDAVAEAKAHTNNSITQLRSAYNMA